MSVYGSGLYGSGLYGVGGTGIWSPTDPIPQNGQTPAPTYASRFIDVRGAGIESPILWGHGLNKVKK